MNKYKATIIKRDEVVRDINHAAWKTSKVRIIEEIPDRAEITQGTISYKDVLYDVDFTTWKTANVRIADMEARAEVQTDGENERWFRRQYKSAVEQVRDLLRPFISIKSEVNDTEDNTIVFRFPKLWTGSIAAMMSYIHHYIVSRILAEWFGMTLPDAAAAHIASAESWKEKTLAEAHSEDENGEWFERQLATAVDHLKGQLRWCITERLGTVTDNTIKMKHVAYGSEDYPAEAQDPTSFDDDFAFLDAPAEKVEPLPEHSFQFKFSCDWRGNFEAMSNYIHRYIVDYILYEWYKMTMPNEAAVYLTSAEAWESKVINEARSEDVGNVFFRL